MYGPRSDYGPVGGRGWHNHQSTGETDSSNIYWGLGVQAHGGGGVSSAFRPWNLVSTRFSCPVGGRFKGKERRPLMYPHDSD